MTREVRTIENLNTESGAIDEENNVCTNHVTSNLTFKRDYISGKVPAISLKIKGRPSSIYTEGVTGSLEVHSRHVMSIVVPHNR